MPTAALLLACIVAEVTDGDTLTARCELGRGLQTIKVRLAEIDAPEKAQPTIGFAQEANDLLLGESLLHRSDLLLGVLEL